MGIVNFARRLKNHTAFNTGPNTKPARQQLIELLQLALRGLHYPAEYYLYRFYDKGMNYPEMLNFLTERGGTVGILANALNDRHWQNIFHNKWMFHLHFGALGVPVTNVYGYYDVEGGFSAQGQPLRSPEDLRALLENLRPSSLVVKPIAGIMGHDLFIVKEIKYTSSGLSGIMLTGSEITIDDILRYVNRGHSVKFEVAGDEVNIPGYLLEERLEQHPELSDLNPYTVNTIRVITFCEAQAPIEIDAAVLRLGRKGLVADNWTQGGISVQIDPKTGRLGQAAMKTTYGSKFLVSHPDTGVVFEGRQLPMWQETVEICEMAARLSPRSHSIGWDVVLTSAGPRIIEGNPNWGFQTVQVHGQGYLDRRIRNRLRHYGLQFPAERLPGYNIPGMARDIWKTETVGKVRKWLSQSR